MTAPKQPQDHKSKAVVGDFTHSFGDHTVTIPSLSSLMTFGFSRTHRHLPPEEQVYLLIEENLDEGTIAALDTMDGTETKEFIEAWQEHSGVESGE
jgi:hypothetical protein